MRDEGIRAAFDQICWVSIGQEPNTLALQQTLYRQFLGKPLPDEAKTDPLLLSEPAT